MGIYKLIRLGKPTHYKLKSGATACGLSGIHDSAYDPRDCDCIRCMKTKRYKKAMGKSND